MDIYDICSLDTTNINYKLKESITKNREKLIVSFIGRVSTGKSSIINSILGDNLLPVSDGQTTKFSIFISGIIDNIFRVKEGDANWETFKSIDEVKDYLLKRQNEKISNIEINLPINIYKILEQCTLIDNPAIGYSDELDEYVLNQCYRSCYLYVLVIDAVASISSLERKFLSQLNKKRQILEIKVLLNFADCIKEVELPIALTHHNRSIKDFFYKSDEIFIFSGYAFTQNKTTETNEKQNNNDSENYSTTVNGNLFEPSMFINDSKVIQFIQTIPNDEEIEQICERMKYLKIKNELKYQNVNIHHNRKSSQDNLPDMHNTHEVVPTNTNKQETKRSRKFTLQLKKPIVEGIQLHNKKKSDQNHRKNSIPNDEKSKKEKKCNRVSTDF